MKNGEKKILSEKVADMLRAKIINGEQQADSRIIESDVAKCMEVSRGPVREALKILEFEGLVTYESNKGCRVTNLSMERMPMRYSFCGAIWKSWLFARRGEGCRIPAF